MNKDLICSRFSKSLKSYDDNAKIQKIMASKLLGYVEKKEYNNILEIGCGTGFLTKLISNNIKFQNFVALDIVAGCSEYVEEINKDIKFINEDVEEFIKNNNQEFDLIISNASLQWVSNFEVTMKSLKSKLNKNGELVVSIFGRENFREIYQLFGTTLDYYSSEQLEEIFKHCTLKIEEEVRVMAFSSSKDVLQHLHDTGVNAIESKAWTKKDLFKFENGYSAICPNKPTLTYNPIYLHIS